MNRVRFTPEAIAAIRAKRAWWEAHREKAPRLFVEELADVVTKLRESSDVARQQYAARGGHVIWRLLMPKTRHHVYYRNANEEVQVLLIWNAVSESGPEI